MLHIPESLPLDIAQQAINAAAAEFADKERARAKAVSILECDEALREFEWQNLPSFGPLVRASTYKKPYKFQEIYSSHMSGDPRRPMLMRGSRITMIAIHTRSNLTARNGYCDAVFDRFLRATRATVLYRSAVNELFQKIGRIILLKHGPNMSRHRYADDGEYIVGGCCVLLSREQLLYLRKLQEIITKTRNLDKELA